MILQDTLLRNYWYYSKYDGAFKAIQSKSWRMMEVAPMLLDDGPLSMMTAQAYLGLSKGKNPTDQECT